MALIPLLLACIGWHCGSPYGPPPVPGDPPALGMVARVYGEMGTGCLVRTTGELLPIPPGYLAGPLLALRGRAIDVEVCGAPERALPIGDPRWQEIR